ncbi:hypothetical protein DMO16_18290 [Fictibacillus sp. S7]|nr:hypothetical protein DMO16_18290 [Fictibacillus sp. S7]
MKKAALRGGLFLGAGEGLAFTHRFPVFTHGNVLLTHHIKDFSHGNSDFTHRFEPLLTKHIVFIKR